MNNDPYLTNEGKRIHFVNSLREKIGCPYHWGANGPDLFDCSGLIVWGLITTGLISRDTDLSALGLANRFRKDHTVRQKPTKPGELCFYGPNQHTINHVMAVLTTWGGGRVILVGARGGTSGTTSLGGAYSQRAYVDVVTGEYWQSKLVLTLDPFATEL